LQPDSQSHLLTIQFEWMNQEKSVCSTFIGTSPEFEMALYSFCFLAGSENNAVSIAGHNVNIKCYNLSGRIGTAFPESQD
jgi:poly(U)-specific endoribonuclease